MFLSNLHSSKSFTHVNYLNVLNRVKGNSENPSVVSCVNEIIFARLNRCCYESKANVSWFVIYFDN